MLEIDRLSLHVRAAAAPERAERLARRLRDAAVSGIERDRYALAPPGAPAYLFVERLKLQCSVNSDWDDAAIGAEVAKSLAAALERSLELPQTVAFRDRVELLAAFYSALAEGRAWERWWFEAFDGLRPLPASAALRTSVINEGAHGVAALARLTEASLRSVLRLLTAGDAKRLLEGFGEHRTSTEASLVLLWKASASLAERNDDHTGLLCALVAAERSAPGTAGGDTLRVLRAMKALRVAAARGDLPGMEFFSSSPHEALRAALTELAMETHWLQRLGESEAELIAEEISSVLNRTASVPNGAAAKQAAHAAAHERLFTRRGGAFVLLKALDWLGWPAMWRIELKGAEADALARAFAWAVVLRALEPRSALQGLSDPALQATFDVERPLALLRGRRREIHAMLNKSTITRTANGLLVEFSRRIPGLAGASPDYLRRNALALPATVEPRGNACVVRLGRAPLDVLLVLAGAKRGRLALPGGAALELQEDA